MTTEELCGSLHTLLLRLPAYTSPSHVPFSDGLYFFYEKEEISPHAPAGRIVRVGNHPRSDGTLVRRLKQHYRGRKNGSVFRRYLGGALIRLDTPQSPCLLPGPGLGHWEKQHANTCTSCDPIEKQVSTVLCSRFSFKCVEISTRQVRNHFEGLIIATLANCRTCDPSPGWLGRHAYSALVQRTGLCNSDFVNGPPLQDADFKEFDVMVNDTIKKWVCTQNC
jgi:hypothetical protein